jgi:hypothetical protein
VKAQPSEGPKNEGTKLNSNLAKEPKGPKRGAATTAVTSPVWLTDEEAVKPQRACGAECHKEPCRES